MPAIITNQLLSHALSYDDYLALTRNIVAGNFTNAKYLNPKTLRYTQSNLERMEKTSTEMVINKKLYNQLSQLKDEGIWLVISEPWCGDASWNTTALYFISSCTEKIEFKILLRDEHPELIARYHTNGSESIPKLICLRKRDLSELGVWGPRPKVLQDLVMKWKHEPSVDYQQSVRQLHDWYDMDKTAALQEEMIDLVKTWNEII